MLNCRRVLLSGTALAAAATVAKAPLAASALARELSAQGRAGDDVIAWLRANALPLASAEPVGGLHDLEPFRAMIGNARIVSLGEATHGTREFFQLKHRLIEYCVAKLGFTVIGFEAEYGATLAVNDYVLHGKGNAVDVVSGMGFWTWDTEEVVALVEWVRAWNIANERKVKFYGFDMQGSAAATQHLLAYLERVAPELAAASATSLAPLALYHTFGAFQRLSAAVQERTFAQIKSVREAFVAERTRWIERSGETEWQLARQSAVVLEQYARSRLVAEEGDFRKEFAFRDRAMADNVHALLDAEGAGAKAVLWAHNGHVQRSAYFGLSNMGGFLQAAAGAEPVVIGFAFNQGSFQAMGVIDGDYKLGTHVVGPAPAARSTPRWRPPALRCWRSICDACRPTARSPGGWRVSRRSGRSERCSRSRTSMNMPWRRTRARISTSWCSSSARPRRAAIRSRPPMRFSPTPPGATRSRPTSRLRAAATSRTAGARSTTAATRTWSQSRSRHRPEADARCGSRAPTRR